uniref:Ovule protein n=1 Tax=Gongylonema pulchrum TaxID=637853 RepID=A0A183DCC8_9BILA
LQLLKCLTDVAVYGVEIPSTYKLKKMSLRKEGYDLSSCHGEQIYIWDSCVKSYKYSLLIDSIQPHIIYQVAQI